MQPGCCATPARGSRGTRSLAREDQLGGFGFSGSSSVTASSAGITRQQGCRAAQLGRFHLKGSGERGTASGLSGLGQQAWIACADRSGWACRSVEGYALRIWRALRTPCSCSAQACRRGPEPRTAGRPVMSGNSPRAWNRCWERSLLERVPGGFTDIRNGAVFVGWRRPRFYFAKVKVSELQRRPWHLKL